MRVAIHTFGCKVNQCDSEALTQLLRERGHAIAGNGDPVDAVIVNTCAVTGESERKARQYLRKIAKENPGVALVVTGCYGQTAPEETARIEGVRLVTGVKNREQVADLIEQLPDGKEPLIRVEPWTEEEKIRWNTGDFPARTRAFLKIEDGCSARCSYCKVPLARGPVRSLPLERVAEEFLHLLEGGHREIVLTGIHLGCYGEDLGLNLARAIAGVDGFSGDYRFRVSSVEPMDFSPELLRAIESSKHLCPHFHIPLQSGSRSVLRRMNRGYAPEDYAGMINRLRSVRPDSAITTDVIAGLPGETQEEFEETLQFIEEVGFSALHVFPFSARRGTAAFDMPNPVPLSLKRERVGALMKLGKRLAAEFQRSMLQRIVGVLIEETGSEGGEGFSEYYQRTFVRGEDRVGVLVKARVVELGERALIADRV